MLNISEHPGEGTAPLVQGLVLSFGPVCGGDNDFTARDACLYRFYMYIFVHAAFRLGYRCLMGRLGSLVATRFGLAALGALIARITSIALRVQNGGVSDNYDDT